MKRIGLLFDKHSKKVFLLPNEVKTLVAKGISVSVLAGYGNAVKLSNQDYTNAGAKVCASLEEVTTNSDVLVKVNEFVSKELKLMSGKIAITMVNYLVNVEMLMHLLKNKVTGLEWAGLANKSNYLIFPEIETLKGKACIEILKKQFAIPFGKGKNIVKYPVNPKLVILNATFAGVQAAKDALAAGYVVELLDNDKQYLKELASEGEFKKAGKNFSYGENSFENLQKELKGANAFINTCIDPLNKNKLRVTNETAKTMAPGALLIDASCETGYAFHFVRKYADKELAWEKGDGYLYLAMQDMSDLFAKKASEIISKHSVNSLITVCESGVESEEIAKYVNTSNGEIVNQLLKTKLALY